MQTLMETGVLKVSLRKIIRVQQIVDINFCLVFVPDDVRCIYNFLCFKFQPFLLSTRL